MNTVLRVVIVAGLFALSLPASAQENWVGKTILLTKLPVKVGSPDESGVNYKVLREKDGRFEVNDDRGSTRWFERADAVLLEDAIAYATKRIKDNPSDAMAYHIRAVARSFTDNNLAMEDINSAICIEPAARFYNTRGVIWFNKDDHDRAIKDFTVAIELNPSYADAYHRRGCAWGGKRERDKAAADFTEAIRFDPKDALAYCNRAHSSLHLKLTDKAIGDLTEAIRLDPERAWAHNLLGIAWGQKKEFDKAIAEFNEAIRIDPKDYETFLFRGESWRRKNEYEKAIADIDEALRLNPKYAAAYRCRGDVWYGKENDDKAIADYTKAIKLDPKDASVFRARANTRNFSNDYAGAIADYSEAIKLDPDDLESRVYRASIWAGCPDAQYRDGAKALESAKTALAMDRQDPRCMAVLAAAYAENGDFASAVMWQALALRDPCIGDNEVERNRLEWYREEKPFRLRRQ